MLKTRMSKYLFILIPFILFSCSSEIKTVDKTEETIAPVQTSLFTKNELLNKGGWGHSSIEQAEEFTELSNVKKTVICHHAPYRTDADIDSLKSRISSDRVSFGCEGESFCM